MSNRVSQTIVLCEDDPQEQLVRLYAKKCGLNTDLPYFKPRNASREVHGGNVGWVIREFPNELKACRKRAARARTLLVVIVDADLKTVNDRRAELYKDVETSRDDPTVVLIPKRSVETWIRAARGQNVSETDSLKNPTPEKNEIREAANQIHGWARDNPIPDNTCVESLRRALPEWREIG